MDIHIEYEPTEKQRLFHSSDANEVLFGGAAGGGKSKAIVMEALQRCLDVPGSRAYLFRRTYPELRDSLIREARASIPPEIGKYSTTTHDLTLVNGSMMHFRYCRNIEDARLYQGAEFHWLLIDELTHFDREVYDFLKTRLRAPKCLGIEPRVRCTANPGGPGHGWVKAYFIDAGPAYAVHQKAVKSAILGASQVRSVQYIPAYPTDNPYLSEDYIYELEQKPPALRRALLHGQWDVFSGQAFTEWRDNADHYTDRCWTHVIKPFAVPGHWPRWRSFDFGYAKPFSVGWWAVDGDGRVYRYRELYGWDGRPDTGCRWHPGQIAGEVRRIEKELEKGRSIRGVADPSIFDESRGLSVAEQMSREGVYFERGDNARLAGKMQLHRRLAFDSEGVPGLQVFETCRQFIRTIPSLVYDGQNPEDVDSRTEDHIYDETRYFLMANPMAAAPVKRQEKPKFDPLKSERVKREGFWGM